MYVGVIRSPSQEELSCKYATAFSFKGICKTDTNVSSFFFGEDIQVLVRYTTFREHASKTAFYRQRIPEPSYLKKETLDIDILLRSNNSDRKIMQPITMMRPPMRMRNQNNSVSSSEHLPRYYPLKKIQLATTTCKIQVYLHWANMPR